MIRTHLKIFYDEVWSDLLQTHYGIKIRPNIIRHNFSWTKPQRLLNQGFIIHKPKIFKQFDALWKSYKFIDKVIKLADNRMLMGDYRYGHIIRQELQNFNIQKEFYHRVKHAYETQNLEYVIDVYNMYRIEAFKQKVIRYSEKDLKTLDNLLYQAMEEEWKLNSVDDGFHAIEK